MTITRKIADATYHVVCNNVPRPTFSLDQLPVDVQAEFDYASVDDGREFVQYRGSWYDLHDGFEQVSHDIKALGFDAFQSSSYFDGVAVRWFDRDGELYENAVVIGHVHW